MSQCNVNNKVITIGRQTEYYYVMKISTGEATWELIYTDGQMD
jgi:hypothetical protein